MNTNTKWQQYFDANKIQWDSRVEPHQTADLYNMEAFMAGTSSLNEIEQNGIGAVTGKSLLHLQCHFGQDTLSFARMGAHVTGIDISSEAIQKAKTLATKLNLHAQFLETDVYNVPNVLQQSYDIVFTSYGCIVWLPDLDVWAKIIADKLHQGGIFYIADFHPTLMLFNFENQKIEYDYFNKGVIAETITHTYTGQQLDQPRKEYFWQHPLSEIISALIKQNLEIIDFQEFDYSPYNCFSNMTKIDDKKYVFGDFKTSFPHVFSIKARKK